MTDVEARHQAAASDAQARSLAITPLLDAVVRQMPVGVLVADAVTRRVVTANERVSELFGTDRRGWSIDDPGALPAYGRDGRKQSPVELPVVRALDDGEVVQAERHIFDCAGELRVVSVSASPVRDSAGDVIAAVAVLEDVTPRERQERAERDFVTNAAHELQTPLAGIASAIEVLQAGAKEEPDDRDRFLAHIQNETQRLTRLAHALLVLARAETGVEAPARERFALRPLLDAVALSIQPAAGVEVRVTCPARLMVTSNRELVEQALTAIAGNAAKFTHAGEIRLGAARDGRAVQLEVLDTGQGIPHGEEAEVFERFYRARARSRDGFGLGLAIARQSIETLGGTIELAPRESGGTRARIRVPDAR